MTALLRQRNFALLWCGGLISMAGDWVLFIGLPIYVFLLTHSVVATSLMVLAGSAPSVVLGTVAGVFVDRWDHKRTMLLTNVLLALTLLPLLVVHTANLVWVVYVEALIESSIQQFFSPAEAALLPVLVGEDHLLEANALTALSSNLARLVGPALGGLVAAWLGLTGIVLLDAASFAIAGLLIARISIVATPSVAPDRASTPIEVRAFARFWSEWVEGLGVIRAERTLTVLLGILAITSLGEGVMSVLYPIFVNRVLHGKALEIGELMSAQAVGGLIGGVVVGWAGRRMLSRWMIGMCGIAFGLLDLAIFNTPALVPGFGLSVGLFVAVGVPGIGLMTAIQSLVQAHAPDAYRGRVWGTAGMTMGVLGLIGTLTAGTVTDRLGVVTVLNLQGLGYILAGLLAMAMLPRRP